MAGKFLIALGISLLIVGLLTQLNLPIPLGRLPGDISFELGAAKVFIPITSSLILSVLLSGLLWIFSKF